MLTAYLGVWEEAGTQGMVGEWAWYGRASTINGGETDRASIVGVQAARWGRGKILSTFFFLLDLPTKLSHQRWQPWIHQFWSLSRGTKAR